MRLKNVVMVLVLVGAGGGLYYWSTQPEPPPSYKTAAISTCSIEEVVTATGTLSALKTVVVGTQTSGIVKSLHADFNDAVKKEQLLAELDPATFEAQVQQAKASLTTARAQYLSAQGRVAKAETEKKRADLLAQQDLISAAERDAALFALEGAKADLVSTEAQVAEASAALKLAQLQGTRTKIFSPIDGIVISRKVDVGQTVAASLSAPELFVIAEDLSKMQVIAEIDEADIGRLKEGMSVNFTVDAFPGETFTGTITQLRYSPTTSNSVVTYPAVIEVNNPERKLRPGMTVNAEFVSARRENVRCVPNAALRFVPLEGSVNNSGQDKEKPKKIEAKPSQRPGKVYVQDGDKLRGVPVTLGISDGQQTELLDGALTDGAEVVTEVSRAKKSGAASPARARF